MTRIIKRIFAILSGFASLGSGMLWHLSADLQISAIRMSNNPSELRRLNQLTPTFTQVELDSAIDKIQKTIENFTSLSAQYNFWAAIFAVVAGVTLATIVTMENE